MTKYSSDKKRIAAIILLFLAVYLTPLAGRNLLEPDEGRYAEIPREMIESGNYITPMLNYVKYFEKPALLYWMNAASFTALGQNAFAARVPSALCALLGIAVTGMFGAFLFGRRTGMTASALTGSSLLYYAIGTINITDMPLAFFMTLTMSTVYVGHIKGERRWYLLSYAAMALGVLTKGLIAVVLPVGILFWYIVFTRKWKLILDILYIPGVMLFFAIAAPWFYLVCRDNPDFFYFFFVQEHFLRYTTTMHNRNEPFWFYLALLPAAVMPWTAFFFALLSKKSTLRSPDGENMRDANVFLVLWFAVIMVFFSCSGSKLIPYIVPCIPPAALLTASNISRMINVNKWGSCALGGSIAIAFLFVAAALSYTFIGDELTFTEDIVITLGISTGLLLGAFFAWKYTRRRDYGRAFFALCTGWILFVFGLQSVYIPLDRTRSAYPVSAKIIEMQRPGETIAVFGEILQGVPFYTKQRVLLIDSMGELKFGAEQKEGSGWFPLAEEFLRRWREGEPLILVIAKKRIPLLFAAGVDGAARTTEIGDYMIFFNKE